MATKNKKTTEDNAPAAETWRKPLWVPPRTNVMRSFYENSEENRDQTSKQDTRTAIDSQKIVAPSEFSNLEDSQPSPKNTENADVEAKRENTARVTEISGNETVSDPQPNGVSSLTPKELSEKLGIKIDDLFDIHELLRGKSFDIYLTLTKSADERGRCKITQLELMKRTGIKNRRTFYKHEDWLIGLRLLEKRHLPGDHKGIVYRVLQLSEVLPLTGKLLQDFQNRLKNTE